jgi:hypothetical protein
MNILQSQSKFLYINYNANNKKTIKIQFIDSESQKNILQKFKIGANSLKKRH